MAVRIHCEMIKKETAINFADLEIAIKTYNRNALVCGAPAWRYVYHTIHSADKWYIDPFVFEEPSFHEDEMDDPDRGCKTVLSDEQLLEYLYKVREKIFAYLDGLDDDLLYDCPEKCPWSRLQLILKQFRHFSLHVGMLNGQTIERTGRFPKTVGPDGEFDASGKLFEN